MTDKTTSSHFTIIDIIISIIFWIEETLIHKFIFGEEHIEIIPHDTNEVWMRLLMIILITGFGIYADYRTHRLLKNMK